MSSSNIALLHSMLTDRESVPMWRSANLKAIFSVWRRKLLLGKPMKAEFCSSWTKKNKTNPPKKLVRRRRRSNALSLSNLLCLVSKDHFPSVSHRDRWPGPASENKCCGGGWLSRSCWARAWDPGLALLTERGTYRELFLPDFSQQVTWSRTGSWVGFLGVLPSL